MQGNTFCDYDPEQLDFSLARSLLDRLVNAKAYPLVQRACGCEGLDIIVIKCGGCERVCHERQRATVRGCTTYRHRLQISPYRALAAWIGRDRVSQRDLRCLFESEEELELVRSTYKLQRWVATIEVTHKTQVLGARYHKQCPSHDEDGGIYFDSDRGNNGNLENGRGPYLDKSQG